MVPANITASIIDGNVVALLPIEQTLTKHSQNVRLSLVWINGDITLV